MIYVLCGANEIAVREDLDSLREQVEPADLREANIVTLDGASLSPEELLAAAMSAPFLSNRRLVIVRGLLGRFDGRRASAPGPWKGIGERLSTLPDTTVLAFADGALSRSGGPLLKDLSDHAGAKVRRHPAPRGPAMRAWITDRAARRGAAIEDRAAAMLEGAGASDMIALDSEIEKLSIYAGDRPISPADVEAMVASSREANIFAAVDAALAGQTRAALGEIRRTLADGQSVGYVLYMFHRQVRLLMLAKELQRKRVSAKEMPKRLGVSGYPLKKTLEQAPRFTRERLAAAHRLLAETDERIKSGGARDEVALDVLVADLAALARRPGRGA